MDDKSKVNLDAPSIPDDEESDVVEEQEESAATSEATESEEESEAKAEDDSEDTDVEQDVPRVPYSRFETINERRIQAEEQLRILREQQEKEQLSRAAQTDEAGIPGYWKELYGDSEASVKAYKLRQQELAEERKQLHESLREEIRREQMESEKAVEETVQSWQDQFEAVSAKSKRSFTESQRSAILDVIDELSPKDKDGKYIVDPIDYLPKAIELYDLRQEKANAKRSESKRKTASLTSARSEGQSTDSKGSWNGDWWSKLNS